LSDKDVLTSNVATKSKHHPECVFQRGKHKGLRSRIQAKWTPDGLDKCMECGYISGTPEEADAHHFRTHDRQLDENFMVTPT
jgi:hypothetical protein